METVSEKSVVRKRFRDMVVLGLGFAVTVGFAPVTTWAGFQNLAKQTCRFNAQSQDRDSNPMRISSGEKIIMARGGNRSGGGGGMGQRGGGNSGRGYKYGPGDGTGVGERPGDGTGYGAKKGDGTGAGERLGDGTGYGAKKGDGTGDCDGTGPKGKGREKRSN